MKAVHVFHRAMRQQLRDRLGVGLTVLTAPAFALVYGLLFGAPAAPRVVLVAPQEGGAASEAVREGLEGVGVAVEVVADRGEPERRLAARACDVVVLLGEDFERRIGVIGESVGVEVVGDVGSPDFRRGERAVVGVLNRVAHDRRGTRAAVEVTTRAVGRSGEATAFDAYVPGLLVFSIIMLVFSSSMAVTREVESGVLERLRLTAMTSLDYLVGMSGVQVVLGTSSVMLTFGVATVLGFESQGPLGVAMALAVLGSVSCVGAGMLVASVTRTVPRAFLVSSGFMFLLVLLSGVIFPIPRVPLGELGGQEVGLFDLLPTTWLARGLHAVLTLGAGWGEVRVELAAMAALGGAFFGAGVWSFGRLHRGFLTGGER